MAGAGVPPAEVERLLRRAEADAELLIADLESVRLRLKAGIKHEYLAMLQGESSLTSLLDAASELLPSTDCERLRHARDRDLGPNKSKVAGQVCPPC